MPTAYASRVTTTSARTTESQSSSPARQHEPPGRHSSPAKLRRRAGQLSGSGAISRDGHGALLQHQARDSQIGYPARHPRAARHRTCGTSDRIEPALCSTGTTRSRGGTTRCAHLRHIRDGLIVPRLDFPADDPADLLVSPCRIHRRLESVADRAGRAMPVSAAQ
jgi:hypothetical protein